MTRAGWLALAAAGLALLALAAGCATTDPAEPFGRVQEQVARRTGQEPAWHRSQEERRRAAERVRALLADGLTLPEAAAVSLAANRRLQAVYHQLGLAQAGLAQAGLLDNPHLAFAYKDNPFDGYTIELEVVQNIISLFMLPLRQRVAQARLARAESLVAGEVVALLGRVRAAYYGLQAAQQAFRLRERLLAASQAAYDMAGRLRQAGNLTRLALLTRRDLRDQDRLALSRASQAVAASRERLNRLLGLWGADTGWRVAGELPPPPERALDLAGLEGRAVRASLDLALAQGELEAQANSLGVTNLASVLPELRAGVAMEREEGDWLRGPALELPIPIFDPGHARRAAARAVVSQAWESYAALAVEVRSQARAAGRALAAARERAVYVEGSFLPLRREMLAQAQLRYNGMFLGVFDLLGYKRLELAARLERVMALRDYWTARSRVETLLAGKAPGAATPAAGGGAAPAMAGGGH